MNDIQIAQSVTLAPIEEIASQAGIAQEHLQPYGRYIAKVNPIPHEDKPQRGKLIL